MKLRIFTLILLVILSSCKEAIKSDVQVFKSTDLNNANTVLLEAVMEDVFTPPVASRIYVYAHLAHYITLQSLRSDSLQMSRSKVSGLEDFKLPESQEVNPELSALLAFSNTGKKLIYSILF